MDVSLISMTELGIYLSWKKDLEKLAYNLPFLVMFIWGVVEGSYEHSWLSVAAGGIISCAVYMIRRDIEGSKDPDNKGESKEDK